MQELVRVVVDAMGGDTAGNSKRGCGCGKPQE